jgi:uncharacterized membrane protein
MSTTSQPALAPGYYLDPATGQPRYFNGSEWGPVAPAPAPQDKPFSGFAIAALVLGLCWFWGTGSILAIVFGVIARKQVKRGERRGGGMATWGLGLGIVGLIAAVIISIAVAVSMGEAAGEMERSARESQERIERTQAATDTGGDRFAPAAPATADEDLRERAEQALDDVAAAADEDDDLDGIRNMEDADADGDGATDPYREDADGDGVDDLY